MSNRPVFPRDDGIDVAADQVGREAKENGPARGPSFLQLVEVARIEPA